MAGEGELEDSSNHSVRTLAAFLGATAIGLLSFTHDIYPNRNHASGAVHRGADDIVDSFLLLGFLFALSVAALRRHKNARIADSILRLSFLTIILGTIIFVWENMTKPVSTSFIVGFAFLVVAYATCIDSCVDGDGGGPLSTARRWIDKYRGLKRPQ